MTRAPLALVLIIAALPFAAERQAQAEFDPPPWLELARSHLGTNPGSWKKDWCSEFVATVIPGPHHFKKWSWTGWKEWGVESPPRPGAVVVLHNHTALINGPCTETRCPIIGGNQRADNGRKLVTQAWIDRKDILNIRWSE